MTKTSKPKYNENYTHECSSRLIDRSEIKPSLVDVNYTSEELKALIDFYITNTPTKKSMDAGGSGRWLGEYGWKGLSDLRSLEGKLLKVSGISSFIMLRSNKADQTINAMKLGDQICEEHPRAVMTQEHKFVVSEDGSTSISARESRMVCLFRHIRNAIAHGQSYLLPNGNLLLDDCNEFGKTASIVVAPQTLIEWVRAVDKNGVFYPRIISEDISINGGDDEQE